MREQLNIKKDPVMQEEYERTVEYKKGSGNVGGVWENS